MKLLRYLIYMKLKDYLDLQDQLNYLLSGGIWLDRSEIIRRR